jgi:hypothetical protein
MSPMCNMTPTQLAMSQAAGLGPPTLIDFMVFILKDGSLCSYEAVNFVAFSQEVLGEDRSYFARDTSLYVRPNEDSVQLGQEVPVIKALFLSLFDAIDPMLNIELARRRR